MEADRKAAKAAINARKAEEIARHQTEEALAKDNAAHQQWKETEENSGDKPMELSEAEKAEIQKYNEKEAAEKKQEDEEKYQQYKAVRAQKEKEAKLKKEADAAKAKTAVKKASESTASETVQ